jgi:hypothetical protein
MAGTHKPIQKTQGKAKGVCYAGIGTNWNFIFGNVIIIAENAEVLATACLMLEERPDHQKVKPEMCKEVAVFQMSDVEVA